MTEKKEYAINLLKQILTALHEKRFGDVTNIVDESTLNVDEIIEFVQGTIELNEFNSIDEYREENIAYISSANKEPFEVVYYINADGGNDIPIVLQLKVESQGETKRTHLDFEPN